MPISHELLDGLFDALFPLPRSITGEGYRRSLDIIAEHMPMVRERVASGTQVFDWIVPMEWKIASATLDGPGGERICDFASDNLSVVNYATPVDAELTLDELQPHLHSVPSQPRVTPYVTSYYSRGWGFCLPHAIRVAMTPGHYRAHIRSELVPGHVEYGLATLPGATKKVILLSSYLCHPSMANNELSGPLALVALYQMIAAWPSRHYTYQFLINPETIGALSFLFRHGEELKHTWHGGLVLTCLGGPQPLISYKRSRRGDGPFDRVFTSLAAHGKADVRRFEPNGSDERQYCSPGFDFPMGQVARTIYGQYPEYHTSGDDKAFMQVSQVLRSAEEIHSALQLNEVCRPMLRSEPHGEPQLGRRGLYANLNSPTTWTFSTDEINDGQKLKKQFSWLLAYADGQHDLIDVAELINQSPETLVASLRILMAHDMVRLVP